jgi:hypothetical protein
MNDQPCSSVLRLIPQKFGKFGKVTPHSSCPHCHKALAADVKTTEFLALCTGPGTGCRVPFGRGVVTLE